MTIVIWNVVIWNVNGVGRMESYMKYLMQVHKSYVVVLTETKETNYRPSGRIALQPTGISHHTAGLHRAS